MKKIFLVLLALILLFGCEESNKYVGLYKDKVQKDCLLAIFPSVILDVAMTNCQDTIFLFKKDDEQKMTRSIVTGVAPEYYCVKIENL